MSIRRFELTDGKPNKFWEIGQDGSSFTVRFGRIGTNGQSQTKTAPSSADARATVAALVKEKLAKGYLEVKSGAANIAPRAASDVEPPSKPAAAARKGSAPKDDSEIATVLASLDRFVENVASLGAKGPLFVDKRKPLTACDAKTLDRFEKEWRHQVPADIRAFWSRGVVNFAIEGSNGELYASTRFDAPGTASMKSARKIFGSEADVHEQAARSTNLSKERPGDFVRGLLYSVGLPLTNDENYIVWDAERGGVWQTSGEPSPVPTEPIAPTFTEFLKHFVAAGCFQCGTASRKKFETYWRLAQPIVPIAIPPAENRWLRHLSRFYPAKDALFPTAGR